MTRRGRSRSGHTWLSVQRLLFLVWVAFAGVVHGQVREGADPGAASTAFPARALHMEAGRVFRASSLDRRVGRWMTRTERLVARAAQAVWMTVRTLAWVLPSALLFLLWSATVAVFDTSLLREVARHASHALRQLWLGVWLFVRLAFDREVPVLPRLGLFCALLYWVVPTDLVGDPGEAASYLDDLALAAISGKAFLWLCPEAAVKKQAERLVARAKA